MRVGVPREIKTEEYRVGLTPSAVREYVRHGHEVLVESGAGAGIGASDDDYRGVGATIPASTAELFATAGMIVKVKEPQASEWAMLRPGQILYTYLHLAPDPEQAKGLIASGATCIAYETVTDDQGGLPLLAPMSEVAGRLAVQSAAEALMRSRGGSGLLLGGVPGVLPAHVVVIGGGTVGSNAVRMAVGLGASVTVVDRSLARLRWFDDLYAGRVRTLFSTAEAIEHEISHADVVIGAVLVPGASAPKLVTREGLKLMRPGSVLVDVAIDQGGCFETSRPTTHSNPVYTVDGVLHYCVANMPGAVPRTSAYALNNATLAHGLALADHGLDAIRRDRHLRAGMNVHAGQITYRAVADALGLPYVDPVAALQ